MRTFLIASALALPGTAFAAPALTIASNVYVEKVVTASNGQPKTVLAMAHNVLPGDQLVFVLRYRNPGASAASGVEVLNPLPAAVAYQQALGDPLVSVDGGRTWGNLGSLFVTANQGQRRAARPDEVTHLRWQFHKPVPAGGSGKFSFRGTVR